MPLDIATRIFEVFIIEGETSLIKILFKMLHHKEKKIMGMEDGELMGFLRTEMFVECLEEMSVSELMEW